MNRSSLLLVIKTSFDCNLSCSYCYEGGRPKALRLDWQTAENIITKAKDYALTNDRTVTFIWHGGEPLLLGENFYRKVVDRQRSFASNFKYSNQLQTNGLLLDPSFASFLGKNKFSVGVSIDGPASIHDAQRVTKDGRGSFKQASLALAELRKNKVNAGVVAVCTNNTLKQMDVFYDFFREKKTAVRINPSLALGNAADVGGRRLLMSSQKYGEALIYLYDRWMGEPEYTFRFDPFYDIVQSMIGGKVRNCQFSGDCHNVLKIFPDGTVYFCGQEHDKSRAVGNINQDNFHNMTTSLDRQKYIFEKGSVKEACGNCEHVSICNGGCTSSAFAAHSQIVAKDAFCEAYKMLFGHIKKTLPPEVISILGVNKRIEYTL